jgi:LmbE family N-acetylglucosaminyl deacetylase
LINLRRGEQRDAAQVLGVAETVMLDHPDGELEYTMALREELCLWIRRFRPNVVLSHDPWRRYMLHPDHRATGWAAADAVVAARDHLFFPEQLADGLTKHRPEALLLWAADQPDHWEDISGTIEQKIEALLCHSSQAATTMSNADRSTDHRAEFGARIKEWASRQGEAAGLSAAESFKMIRP